MGGFKETPPDPNADSIDSSADLADEKSISELPSWWRSAIKEFDEHDLPPYQPPRFADGVIKHEIVEKLESQYDVTIRFIGINTQYGDNWHVRIDDEIIGEIGHIRAAEGFSVFKMESDEFEEWIHSELQLE